MRFAPASARNSRATLPPQRRHAILFAVLISLPGAASITFSLLPATARCISETIPVHSLLTGDWKVDAAKDAAGSTRVIAPDGTELFSNKEAEGHFSVTALATGLHQVCVLNNATIDRQVTLNVKTALEVEDHAAVAKQEHVAAIEAELDRMKEMAVHVYEEMLYMRARGDAMHNTSQSTRSRLLWVELVMMCTLLLMGLWQIQYLRNCARRPPRARDRDRGRRRRRTRTPLTRPPRRRRRFSDEEADMTGFAVNIYRWQWHKHITLHGKNCAASALFSVLVPIRAEHPLALFTQHREDSRA